MEDCPQHCIAEIAQKENLEKGEDDHVSQEGAEVAPERMVSQNTNFCKHVNQDPMINLSTFPCQHCERKFTSKLALERHMHIHTLSISEANIHKSNRNNSSFGLNLGQQQGENMILVDSNTMVTQLCTSPPSGCKPALLAEEPSAQPEGQEELDGHYGCKYCEKVFTSHTNQRRHERRVHEQEVQPASAQKSQLPEENYHLQSAIGETSQHSWSEPSGSTALSSVTETEQAEQYMLDISSNISENLSIYINGKILSTSTVSSCESAETSSLIRLDSLVLDQYKDIDGQPPARRRTATPPLLPQIKTELESEVVMSSATSSLVCSLIENILPQNSELATVQKERMVFLSPKLKQLLEKQDGLQPALALITDGQKPCSPVSLSALPAGTGRFKRRTGSPSSSPTTIEESPTLDSEDCQAVSMVQVGTQNTYVPVHQAACEVNLDPNLEDPTIKNNVTQGWPPLTGGNSCNQQPLDLSNALKRNEEKDEAVLDLSLQKTTQNKSEVTVNSISPAVSVKEKPSAVALRQDLLNTEEQNEDPTIPETPLVADFAIVEGSNMMPPAEPVAESLIYGLALSPNPLNPTAASLAPVALQQASQCAIAFASPVSNGMLPTTPSLITVLAPPTIPNPTNQPIQVLTPNLNPEPLLICAENTLSSSQCNLAPAFAAANPANLVALSQPLDPTLNLPGHVFLTDHITLNQPLIDSAAPMSEVPFSPAINLTDPLINSYNIAGNTVLIECTIALEASGSLVQPIVSLPGNGVESSAPPEVVVDSIEQIVTVSNPQTVDPPANVSSVNEPVTLAPTTSAAPDDPSTEDFSPKQNPHVELEAPTIKSDEEFSSSVPSQPSPSSAEAEGDESSSKTSSNEQPQTFAKNFTCNVCDKLFHSMKALGKHVSHHADEWPYKCEFCVLLFVKPSDLLEHRSSLHGVGKAYVCSCCCKDFVYLSNLKQHQEELHPGQQCTYTEEEKGKLRPHNYNNWVKSSNEPLAPDELTESQKAVKKEGEADGAAEELLTTIKILASDGGKRAKGPDIRMGINQHYPSFKPPPFPYHNRSPSVSVASATNFTTHNIPQTFTTAIRCTKCGKSFDNMPELHKHILACASASDKKRYTPKKNPIPLRHFAKTQNGGVLSTSGLNASNRPSQSQKSKPGQEPSVKLKVLKKRKKHFVQRVMPQRNKSISTPSRVAHAREETKQMFVCPHCRRDFTMRRSRTKHMAVCPKKPKEAKKQKEDGVSLTKENNRHLLRTTDDKVQQTSPHHRTRLRTAASSAKRHAVVPVQTVFSSKRSKIIIKESVQPAQEPPSLGDLPIVRTFSPSMRQYSRTTQRVKGIPLKITLISSKQKEQQELAAAQNREKASADILGNLQHDPAV